eukprot:CAMPEP_0183704318 /NCGR_PEP_ID=MMETSP0737-20130205/1682_1 /TAXON_ID=385413 /ORGANISM="Thalassiosira miniscula, Strain CCMP1093" /LENGTH=150 /DNA_ID=CAMNT_0025931157 /DNA_START=71 /DNA_END=520 /DNA_ORIENTATION=+
MGRVSIAATLAVLVLCLTETTKAFSPAASSASCHRPSSRLHSTADGDRIKKAGAGITTLAPGDFCCFDPNEKGKLQGSNNLMERIENGASFTLSGALETPLSPEPAPEPEPAAPEPTTPTTPAPEVERRSPTSNLTKLLNGEMMGRFTRW